MNVEQITNQVHEGNLNALDAFIALKESKKEIEAALKEIEEDALLEASKYGAKTFDHAGWKIQLKDGSRRWNFKECQSWNTAKETLTEVEATLKAAYQAGERNLHAVTEDGEELELPQVTYSKSSISITPSRK